jgi:hydroxymethylbilane synthase
MAGSLPVLKLATRSSPLALWQARFAEERLRAAGFATELIPIETLGDRKLDTALSKIGDKGVFTRELENLLLSGQAHLAVHSAKDMPSQLPEGLEILAFTRREQPHDVVVSPDPDFRLEDKPLRVGTASTRRVAILHRHFPGIEAVAIRGNLQTRIRKMEEGQCQALILAFAGVWRMGFGHLIREHLSTGQFTPAVGQGSLAIEAATSLSAGLRHAIRLALNHGPTESALLAERAFLRTVEGGCSVPVFGYASVSEGGFRLSGGLVSLDGSDELRGEEWLTSPEPDAGAATGAGIRLANRLLDAGGRSILQKIKQDLQS